MISTHEYSATLLQGAGHDLHPPRGGRIIMDEGWSPHVQATVTMPIPAANVQELLDPRAPRRVELQCSSDYHDLTPQPSQTRTFNLGLRDRRIGHLPGTVELVLESDEALLMDDVWLGDGPNTDALAQQHSLRAIINQVLARIGAALQPGATDTAFKVVTDSTNMLPNPTAAVDTSNTTSANLSSFTRVVSAIPGSSHNTAFRLAGSTTQSDSFMTMGGDEGALRLGMAAGRTYFLRGRFRKDAQLSTANGPAHARARRMVVMYRRASTGATVHAEQSVAATNGAGASDQLLTLSFTLPDDTTQAWIRFYHGHLTSGLAYWYDLRLSEASGDYTDTGYYDGDTANTAEYAYGWTGAVGVSTSTRTALLDRSPDVLRWDPGKSAWDFVQPLFRAAGMRLFCDERRRWFLVDTSYLADGHTQLAAGVHLTDATDEISRDGDEWYDAALVEYRWRDESGTEQVRYDWHAAPGHTRVRVLVVEAPYPGPGAAEYMVKRAEGKGRQITASAVSQYTALPTQPITVTLPNTPIQVGVIGSVEWSLDNDEMTLRMRGLTDTPLNAIDLLVGTIDSLVGTIDSL